MTKTKKIFFVRSATARIREMEATIIETDKRVWAEIKGKRYLLGVKVFFTLKSAEVRKLGLLKKVADKPVLGVLWQTRSLYLTAQDQLAKFKAEGKFH